MRLTVCFVRFTKDRGSHYWHTPKTGGKVDKVNLTQFGDAMKRLDIRMIVAYSPQARGRSERAFATHQGRLPHELALHGITDIDTANAYLRQHYMPAFNAEFGHPARKQAGCVNPLRNFLAGDSAVDYVLKPYHQRYSKRTLLTPSKSGYQG